MAGKSVATWKPRQTVMLTVCGLLLIWWASGRWYQARLVAVKRAQVQTQLATHDNALTAALLRRLALLDAVAAYVNTHPSEVELAPDFDKFAAQLHKNATGIRNFVVSPGGINRFVYPLKGNEVVRGHDVLRDERPAVKASVKRAMDTRRVVVSGPYEMRIGGLGYVARQAIFKDGKFWGMIGMTLDMPDILGEGGVSRPASGLSLALRNESGEVFFGPGSVFQSEPVVSRIHLPEGYWELAAIPSRGWDASIRNDLILFEGGTLAIVLLLAGVVHLGINRQVWLMSAVEQRTADFTRELADRKRAENELRRLAEAVNQAAEAVVITDVTGTIVYVNPAFEEVAGYSAQEAVGKTPRLLKSGKHDETFYREFWKTITAGQTWSGRIVNKRKDGTLFTEDCTVSPVRNERGEIERFVAVKKDVTKELELEEQLRHAQKMEAVGQLAGGVAHDFNNLLQVINGYTDVLLTQLGLDSPARPKLEKVAKAGDRAARLVGQLLAFSRRQVLKLEDLDLNEVVGSLIKMIGRVIGEHIRIRFVPAPGLGVVHADRGQLEQVLMNLCINARDAMPGGGSLTIETRSVIFDAEYAEAHAWARPGRYVELSVTDTGSGIDQVTQEHIFEPFFTTKGVGEGTGLGLATVYGIISQHGGVIRTESQLGEGTSFKIYLPLLELRPAAAGVEDKSTVGGGTETILLAEDEEMVREFARHVLEEAGYRVLAACDGKEALQIYRDHAGTVDLALLDVIMPGLGGRAVYDALPKQGAGLRFLFASGYSTNLIQTGLVSDQRFDVIQKPFSPQELLRKVRRALDEPPPASL